MKKTRTPHEIVAAIDIGTNSAHLAVGRWDHVSGLRLIETEKITLQLGKHLDARGYLSIKAIERTIETVGILIEMAQVFTPKIQIVATHATRSAQNAQEMLDSVYDRYGYKVEVIDGSTEARICYLGVQAGLPLGDRIAMVIDIGGGSTEFIVGRGPKIRDCLSLPLGAVVLNKFFFGEGSPSDAEIVKARLHIKKQLQDLNKGIAIPKECITIFSSGTAKSIAIIDSYLHHGEFVEDINGHKVQRSAVEAVVQKLVQLRQPSKIKSRLGLSQSRSEMILAGSLILSEIVDYLGIEHWYYSTFALREGILLSQLADTATLRQETEASSQMFPSDLQLEQVIQEHHQDIMQAKRVARAAIKVMKVLSRSMGLSDLPTKTRQNQNWLHVAAMLHEIGRFVHFSNYHQHSGYLITHMSFTNMIQLDKFVVAYIVLMHRKNPSPDVLEWPRVYYDYEQSIRFLAACLRIAVILCRSRQDSDFTLKSTKAGLNTIKLQVLSGQGSSPWTTFRLQSDLRGIQRLLGIEVVLE